MTHCARSLSTVRRRSLLPITRKRKPRSPRWSRSASRSYSKSVSVRPRTNRRIQFPLVVWKFPEFRRNRTLTEPTIRIQAERWCPFSISQTKSTALLRLWHIHQAQALTQWRLSRWLSRWLRRKRSQGNPCWIVSRNLNKSLCRSSHFIYLTFIRITLDSRNSNWYTNQR